MIPTRFDAFTEVTSTASSVDLQVHLKSRENFERLPVWMAC
jgi:hypothetical protein